LVHFTGDSEDLPAAEAPKLGEIGGIAPFVEGHFLGRHVCFLDAAEVLARLRDAFRRDRAWLRARLDDLLGNAARLEAPSDEHTESVDAKERLDACLAEPEWIDGVQIRKLPRHNRESGGLFDRGEYIGSPKRLDWARDKRIATTDRTATLVVKAAKVGHHALALAFGRYDERDPKALARLAAEGKAIIKAARPSPAPKPWDLDETIESARKLALTKIREIPSYWSSLCAVRARFPDLKPSDRNAEQRADEAMSWIADAEDEPANERARQIVLAWLRSGKSQGAFADAKGLHRQELRRIVNGHCELIARRANTAISADRRAHRDCQTLVRGADEIARITRRKPASTLRLIEGGRAPIGELAGQPVALRELLDVSKYRSTAKVAA
jgi:hypothetical protein